MATRITNSDLQYLVDRLNDITDSPKTAWKKVDGTITAQVGHYHIGMCYGGVRLDRMHCTSGSVKNVFGMGYAPKRELHNRIAAYIAGIESQLNVDKGE